MNRTQKTWTNANVLINSNVLMSDTRNGTLVVVAAWLACAGLSGVMHAQEGVQPLSAPQSNAGLAEAEAPPAPATRSLADMEAAPEPANAGVGGGSLLQNLSKARDAEASSRTAASLETIKAGKQMDNATRESEAKLREALTTRDQAGAAALSSRQQDAVKTATKQAAGSIGSALGDGIVQGWQQGAQAAAQAVGSAAAGKVADGASGAGGRTSGGSPAGAAAPAATASTGGTAGGGTGTAGVSASGGGKGAGAVPPPTAPTVPSAGDSGVSGGQTTAPTAPVSDTDAAGMGKRAVDRRHGQPYTTGTFTAVCPKHGKYGGDIGRVKGCPKCALEQDVMYDAFCPIHGKYGGRGPSTGCPKCAKTGPTMIR